MLQATPSQSYLHASPGSLNRSPRKSPYTHSPSASQAYTSPLTSRAGSLHHAGSPYPAGSASPHSSAGFPRHQTALPSHDLLLPMMPSTEESKLHATVSNLRFALQDSQLQLSRSQQQVGIATTVCMQMQQYMMRMASMLSMRCYAYLCMPPKHDSWHCLCEMRALQGCKIHCRMSRSFKQAHAQL